MYVAQRVFASCLICLSPNRFNFLVTKYISQKVKKKEETKSRYQYSEDLLLRRVLGTIWKLRSGKVDNCLIISKRILNICSGLSPNQPCIHEKDPPQNTHLKNDLALKWIRAWGTPHALNLEVNTSFQMTTVTKEGTDEVQGMRTLIEPGLR